VSDDPLLGCRLKLFQAYLHLQSLEEEVERFLSTDSEQPPPHLGVIVGDFLHNLSCVLDHLVWQLVLLNGKTPTRANQFPITRSPERFEEIAEDRLRGVAGEHRQLIEGFQPYLVEGGNPSEHHLAVLHELSNIDKHRFVHPVVVVGDANTRRVTFTELGATMEALGELNIYMTYGVMKRFERLFPLPAHVLAREAS